MGTRKNHKSKKSKKTFRKTRSKRQKGGADADECIICLGDLNDNCITTECGHKFDRECLRRWCNTSPNDTKCPICREPISNTCMELNPSLFWASKNGRTEIVAELLEKGVSDRAKNRALYWASSKGHVEIVAMLLDNGADVNVNVKTDDLTALMLASLGGHIETVETLLKYGADVNAKDNKGYTALMRANMFGHPEIVRLLLNAGADVNATNKYGDTALIEASRKGHTEIVRLLLNTGADVTAKTNKYGDTALYLASREGHTEIVALLTAAIEAEKKVKGHKQEAMKLVRHRDVKIPSLYTSIQRQMSTGDRSSVFNHFGMRPPGKLGGKRKTRKTRSKRQRGGVSEAQRNDELLNLIDLNDPDVRVVIANLLEEGVSPVAKNTALLIASRKGYVELVEMLLNNGADVNATDNNGDTALSFASQNGHTEIVAMLLAARADVNIKSDFGGTALMLASLRGHTEIVAKLLAARADVNAENNYGQTALSLASLNGHTDIVKLLKQYIVAQTLPRHLERQQDRLQVGRVMDSKKMPGDLTHKIITEHFGGKRKSKKTKGKTKCIGKRDGKKGCRTCCKTRKTIKKYNKCINECMKDY